MRDLLFDLKPQGQTTLQGQIRERLVQAILDGHLPGGERLPSSRRLARTLGVSRNTVTLAYQTLVDDGFLAGKERSGYYVDPAAIGRRIGQLPRAAENGPAGRAVDWDARLKLNPSQQRSIEKPADWSRYKYPFVYGQVDLSLFPIAEWRECSRMAHGRRWLEDWAADHHAADDPLLVEQIRTRLLPRRGVMAGDDEILVTLGAQQSLYLVAALLAGPDTEVMVENPGYPDVRNILQLVSRRLTPLPVDGNGLIVDDRLNGADLVYTTPSHQAPTTVTMPPERRVSLLERATEHDFLIIEDDYELETNYVSPPSPALKSIDRDGRVLYIGSLSKSLFPGLRLGYLVASKALIAEARALRRLMVRHPPNLDQRTAALFLQLGHHDALAMRLSKAYQARWHAICLAIDAHLPKFRRTPSLGGSSVWLTGPKGFDTGALAKAALAAGIVIEPGAVYFAEDPAGPPPGHCCRLGFSSVPLDKIEPGIQALAKVAAGM